MTKPELKGARIAIIGLGGSQVDFAINVQNSKTWDEIWVINSAVSVYHADRMFMMDPASRYLDTEDAGLQTEVMRRVLPDIPAEIPIYSCVKDERVPAIVEYPLAEIAGEFATVYFNNTVAYAIAFALWCRVGHIDFYGIDFSYKHNLHFAEAGRACCEFWISKCMSEGIMIGAPSSSSLMDNNVELDQKLYGYHRLDDPLVALMDNDSRWLICPKSQLNEAVKQHELQFDEAPTAPEPYRG